MTQRPSAAEIEAPLLEIVRREIAPDAAWAEPPSLLGDGVIARAFALRLRGVAPELDVPLVCRLFFDATGSTPSDQTRVEAALHQALVGLGYPTPRVHAAGGEESPLGVPFMLMDRVPGRPVFVPVVVLLVAGIGVGPFLGWLPLLLMLVVYWSGMSRLLGRLHALPAEAAQARLEAAGLPHDRLSVSQELRHLEQRTGRPGFEGFAPVIAWLKQRRPPEPAAPTVCHGDFWMGNVLLGRWRVSLLDWTQARLAWPEYDLGWMRIQHYSRPPLPWRLHEGFYDALAALARPGAWLLLGVNGWVYSLLHRTCRDRVRYYGVLHAVRVLVRVAELGSLGRDGGDTPELVAWGSPRTVGLLRRRVQRDSGCTVSLPGVASG